jgi:hypothetical protein
MLVKGELATVGNELDPKIDRRGFATHVALDLALLGCMDAVDGKVEFSQGETAAIVVEVIAVVG